ncbi:hypothetical protein GALMADRAFT_134012 [Galerina marginata CBS 339.88]|uniref:Uncharacterized protein n=1 Tax=Galerina marginata (strain CBS 339.88) TaxID=685588 RepID=A0A067TR50_GALM3|nr:hypothetical protein GALMADRAFT_134012 [Galerina marginata CBS 339.88]
MSTSFQNNDLVKVKKVILGRKVRTPDDGPYVAASLEIGTTAKVVGVERIAPARDTIVPSTEITAATAITYRYKLEVLLTETYVDYTPGRAIPASQCKVKHIEISLEKGGPSPQHLLEGGQRVFYIGYKPLTFVGTGGSIVTITLGTCLRITSGPSTNTGSSHRAISTGKAFYEFQIMNVVEIPYRFRSTSHVVHENLEAA